MTFFRCGSFAAAGFALIVVACGRSENDDGDGGGSSSNAGNGGSAGSAGTGGRGAMRGYRPPARHVQSCQRLCEREAEAMCPSETTFEKCVEDCNVGILFQACADLWDPVAQCIDATNPIVCGPGGNAILPDCIPPYQDFVYCLEDDGLTGELDPECNAHCTAATAAACPNGEPLDECVNGCRIIASAFPVCADPFATYLTCGAAAEQGCDAEGEPTASGCAGVFGTFLDCLAADYGWQPGRGLPQ